MASFQPDSDNTIYQENANSADDGTTLFLGDLSVYSTENHIRELFQPYGKIENVRIKRGNSTKPHLCYGFIKFDSRTAAEKALSGLNGVMFLGRTLRVGWAEKKSQNPQQVAQPQQQQQQQYQQQRNGGNMKGNTKGMETAQIHVSFISKQIDALISESTLRSLFSMYGEVIDVAIKKSQFDKKLKLQNGYGFVHYRLDEQGIQSAIQATSAIHQVTIDRVTYDCSLSHSLEVMIQQQGIQAPVHHGDSTAIDDQQHLGIGEEEEDVTHLPPESALADLPEQPLSTVNLSTLQSAVAHNDQGVTAAFPMLQAPAIDGGSGHYQIQNAQPDYQMRHEDFSTTLEFFPKFVQPDSYGFPHHLNPHAVPMPPGAIAANPFHSLAYPAANPTYLNPNFQLGMFYPPGAADFSTHLFPPTMSPSPMNTSFYDDGKMAAVAAQSTSFPLKHFEGLGGLSGIGLGAFDSTAHGHTPTGLADYQAPFPSLHNPFQTSSFEPLRFPSLSSTGGVNEDLSHPSQPAANIHFNQQF